MPAPRTRQVNQYVIFVNVTIKNHLADYKYLLYGGGPLSNKSLGVRLGDQVAWYVRVIENSVQRLQRYGITFANPGVFGRASLDVPDGGFSPFLQVVALPGSQTKYSLTLPGISPADDPDIQVDGDGLLPNLAVTNYVVSWQQPSPGNPNGTMTYTVNGQTKDFPPSLPVFPGDKVTFEVTPAAPFDVTFTGDNHTISTPFVESPNFNVIPGRNQNGGTESTDQLEVAHDPDSDPGFPFFVALHDDPSKASLSFTFSVTNH